MVGCRGEGGDIKRDVHEVMHENCMVDNKRGMKA